MPPLIGRTGTFTFASGPLPVTITAVDHHLQKVYIRSKGGTQVSPDPDTFWKNFAWDPILPPGGRPIQVGDTLQEGDVVRFIAPTSWSFTQGKTYLIGGCYWKNCAKDRLAVMADDLGRENGQERSMFELVRAVYTSPSPGAPPTSSTTLLAQVKNRPAHHCDDPANQKLYDSGWSRYRYCTICDKKFDA